MPKQSLALEPNGPRRLEISWKAFWKDTTVRLDGQTIGTFDGQKDLRAGKEFTLPDESKLHVQLVQQWGLVELRVLRDGQLISRSASHPETRLKLAGTLIYLLAGINLVFGLGGVLGVGFFRELGAGWISLIIGVIFLVLATFTMKRSMVAIILAVALYALDGLAGACAINLNGGSAVSTIIVHIGLLLGILPGVGAIRELNKPKPSQ